MNKRAFIHSTIIIATAFVALYLKYIYAYFIFGREQYNSLPVNTKMLMINIPQLLLCLFVTWALYRFSFEKLKRSLGLDKNLKESLWKALICCLPMLIGYYYISGGAFSTDFETIFWGSVWPGFDEELIFRSFLFGLLIRLCGWNLFAALLLPGVLFASGHLYQADNGLEAFQVFTFTTVAAAGFSFFYICWGWNIWFPIFMHIFMDLSWTLYQIDANVLGNSQTNLYRFSSIGLAIVFTALKMKKEKISLREVLKERVLPQS